MKLYFVPRTRATRPRWMLEELEVPYELVRLDPSKGETHAEAHTARHPLGHVPVLETRDGTIFESCAIVLHLADLHPDKQLLGAPGSHQRALAYQWLFYAMTELEPPCTEFSALARAHAADGPGAEAPRKRFDDAVRPLERHLSANDYVVGAAFSVADVVVASVLAWGNSLGLLVEAPHAAAYVARMKARPAFARAMR